MNEIKDQRAQLRALWSNIGTMVGPPVGPLQEARLRPGVFFDTPMKARHQNTDINCVTLNVDAANMSIRAEAHKFLEE